MKMGRFFSFFLILLATQAFAKGKYDFLNKFDRAPREWAVEKPVLRDEPVEALSQELTGYYEEFQEEDEIKIFYGFGYQSYVDNKETDFYAMLQALATEQGMKLTDWNLSNDKKTIRFVDSATKMPYVITLSHERNEFAHSFADHNIVMYHGHSRYGRGPAFDSFHNYFRMGNVFPTIEVDTRNPYFQTEPMELTEQYPPQSVTLDGKPYQYQYVGQKTESSYLPADAYTKNIPGMDEDFKNAKFYDGKQLFYLYSCSNVEYWKNPIREQFPDSGDRFVFGTKDPGYWSEKPAAVFLMSVVQGVKSSDEITKRLNDTNDCGGCFTTY
jgi:hypothetical protein